MRFTFEFKEYRIKFRHQKPTSRMLKIPRKGLSKNVLTMWLEVIVPGWTFCCIQCKKYGFDLIGDWCDIGDFIDAHSAYAYQSKKDRWSKEIGRQVSLGKALKGCSPEFIKAAEKAYYERMLQGIKGPEIVKYECKKL